MPEARFEAAPLLALYDGPEAAAEVFGVDVRTINRWAHTGLSWLKADRMANRAGFHPATLWGWEWFAAALEEEEQPEQLTLSEGATG